MPELERMPSYDDGFDTNPLVAAVYGRKLRPSAHFESNMRIKHTTTTGVPSTTTEPNAWLPGFDPCPSRGCGTQAPPGADAMPKPAAEWWVRSGKKQKLDKLGLPSGFTHELMFGKRRIKSGQGADDRRQLVAQAAFFNEKHVQPSDSKSESC